MCRSKRASMSMVWFRTKGLMSITVAVGLTLISAGSALAQGYYGNPNVIVDPSVLDELGPPLNVADFVSPRPIVTLPFSENLAFSPPPRPSAPLASGPATPTPWGKKPSAATKKAPAKAAKPKAVAQAVPPKEPKKKSGLPTKSVSAKPVSAKAASLSAPPPVAAPTSPVEMTAAPQTAPLMPAIPAPPAPPAAVVAPPAPPVQMAAAPEPAPAPPALPVPQAAPPTSSAIPSLPPPTIPNTPALQPISPAAPQIAALPDASAIGKPVGDTLQITFPSGATKFADTDKAQLKSLVDKMLNDQSMRVELVAYAEGTDATANKARGLSLSRAQSIRGYLIDQGLRNSRVDMRVLGHKVKEGNPDRVDIIVLKR